MPEISPTKDSRELIPFPVTPTPLANPLDTSYTDAAPAALQLLLGTLELDGSDQAVTRGQAAALLPLWQAYGGLTEAEAQAGTVPPSLISIVAEYRQETAGG